jgi:hypothetical protein
MFRRQEPSGPTPRPQDDYRLPAETEATKILELLRECPIGEIVTYKDMNAVIGRDIKKNRYAWLRANRLFNEECGAIFVSVRGEGYRRIRDDEAPIIVAPVLHRQRRSLHRLQKTLKNTYEKSNSLSDEDRRGITRQRTHLLLACHILQARHAPEIDPLIRAPDPALIAKECFQKMRPILLREI